MDENNEKENISTINQKNDLIEMYEQIKNFTEFLDAQIKNYEEEETNYEKNKSCRNYFYG